MTRLIGNPVFHSDMNNGYEKSMVERRKSLGILNVDWSTLAAVKRNDKKMFAHSTLEEKSDVMDVVS